MANSNFREIECMEIYDLGKKTGMDFEDYMGAITKGTSLSDFKDQALEFVHERQRAESSTRSGTDSFSLLRFIRNELEHKEHHQIDRLVMDRFADGTPQLGRSRVPMSALKALHTGTPASGGDTIDKELQKLIDPLDAQTPAYNLATKIESKGNLVFPKVKTPSEATWVGETQAPVETNIDFGTVEARPHFLRCVTLVSKNLIYQSTVGIENLIRQDLRQAFQLSIEREIFKATGTTPQPSGLEARGLGTIRYANNTITYDHLLSTEEKIFDSNVVIPEEQEMYSGEVNEGGKRNKIGLDWVTSSKMRRLMKKTPALGTGTEIPLWESGKSYYGENLTIKQMGSKLNPKVLDYDAHVNTYVDANDLWFGNWAELFIVSFGGVEFIVDQYTLATRGIIRIVAMTAVDFLLRHDASIVRLKGV